jgi:peptide/nickel transport system substrate-binding protein
VKVSRRSVIGTGLAIGALGAPRIARAQAAPPAAKTLRAVMQGDLRVFDPIWTTANITAYHGAMIYDMLFANDADLKPQPQMVGKWDLSDDKKTYTFMLRDGLKWHDGTPVTARDCVASIRRWGARDGGGQVLLAHTADLSAKDDKTFVLALKEPFGLTLDLLAKQVTSSCFVMREKDAETPPDQQVTANIGSGPFKFNHDESKPGARYVYDKNADYVPRAEPASGLAGGKVVKLDRVIWDNIADEQTAIAALQSGEIDFMELPPIDLLPQLQSDPSIAIDILNKTGNVGIARPNWLHKPFSEVKARQALLYLVNQLDYMKATFGDPKYYRTVDSLFGYHTPMSNDTNTDWFKHAPDLAKAKQLFAESGYSGEPVITLQATNFAFMNNAAQLMAGSLHKIGVNAQLAPSDWGGVVTRRSVMADDDKGGWDLFFTYGSSYSFSNPITLITLAMSGKSGWYGWPSNSDYEALRIKWAFAPTLEDRKAIARQMQQIAWDVVPTVYLGCWDSPSARRTNVKGMIGVPEIIPFWNVEKT